MLPRHHVRLLQDSGHLCLAMDPVGSSSFGWAASFNPRSILSQLIEVAQHADLCAIEDLVQQVHRFRHTNAKVRRPHCSCHDHESSELIIAQAFDVEMCAQREIVKFMHRVRRNGLSLSTPQSCCHEADSAL